MKRKFKRTVFMLNVKFITVLFDQFNASFLKKRKRSEKVELVNRNSTDGMEFMHTLASIK